MPSNPGTARWAVGGLACLFLSSCQSSSTSVRPANPGVDGDPRTAAYLRLTAQLDTFNVSGAVHTSEGLLLPEHIEIEIRSEICVESREPGARFWSLDYDTCFTYVSIDTVDESGEYSVSVPSIDADQSYESHHPFGDLRLVQRGPVSFLADSDAGWRHQETFTSSRSLERNVVLTLEPELFYVVRDEGVLQERPRPESPVIRTVKFGTGIEVIRFQKGWAQCLMGKRIGWMEMRYLGTEAEMKERAPLKGKPELQPLDRS